jgi:nicotinamidase-related amidase
LTVLSRATCGGIALAGHRPNPRLSRSISTTEQEKFMTSLPSLHARVTAVLAAVLVLTAGGAAVAQAPAVPTAAKASVLPTGGGAALLDPADTAFLLLDHQSGLFQTVKDIPIAELRSNVVLLAKLATLMRIPVITTASEPNGTNGPLMPEIDQNAPHAVYVARRGEVNAWDNADFVEAVRKTGRKTLVMAGVWTSVCVMFPALDAKLAGYKVYAVMDASGDVSEMANRTTLARFVQGGVIPITANAVLSEIHRTWNRPEAAQIGGLYAHVSPNYAAVVESYTRAQDALRAAGAPASGAAATR